MQSTTLNRLGTVRAAVLHYKGRTETEASSTPGIDLAVQVMGELAGDLDAVLSRPVPNDGETWRASMASLLIAVGYLGGAFLEKDKASGLGFEDSAFESQILIACSYLEAAVSLILSSAVTGQDSLVANLG